MHHSKHFMPSRSGQLLRRRTERRSWEPVFEKLQMPKSKHFMPSKKGVFWALTASLFMLHLLAVFVVFPLYNKDGFRDEIQRRFPSAERSIGKNQSLEAPSSMADAEKAEEISVSVTSGSIPTSRDSIINLDHGDPKMYEQFWRQAGNAAELVISGSQTISYFSDVTNLCWFLEPEFAAQIRRIHRLVGNAVTNSESYIIVGTGSSQLFQAALYALATSPKVSSHDGTRPLPVVSSAPYYSSYPAATDLLQSGLFRWAGDTSYLKEGGSSKPYIEVVCSPNNPDGLAKSPSSISPNGKVIHDLAYYWPQYTAITGPADHDIMLFTVSKCTGHAGMRLGWAIVKDREVAKRMTKFIEISTIGVSKDSQLRAAKLLKAVFDQYNNQEADESAKLFHFGRRAMRDRWLRLREAVAASGYFSLPAFSPEHCNFMKESTFPSPAFAWLKCERDTKDCESFLRHNYKIIARNGKYFGADAKYVRISMLDCAETFNMFIERLSSVHL